MRPGAKKKAYISSLVESLVPQANRKDLKVSLKEDKRTESGDMTTTGSSLQVIVITQGSTLYFPGP